MFELRGPFGKRVVGVAGGRGAIDDVDEALSKLQKIDEQKGTTTQVFEASRIAGKGHLIHAARLALNACATKMNLTSSLGIELVCWVAAERQIDRAFQKVGLCKDSETLAFLTIGSSRARVRDALTSVFHGLDLKRDDEVIELTRKKIPILLKVFSISKGELEIAPAEKLVLERIALLALEK